MSTQERPRRSGFLGEAEVVRTDDAVAAAFAERDSRVKALGDPVHLITENYDALFGEIVLVEAPVTGLIVTLPTASESDVGGRVDIKNHSDTTNPISIRVPGSDFTLEGIPNGGTTLSTRRSNLTFIFVGGGEWVIL